MHLQNIDNAQSTQTLETLSDNCHMNNATLTIPSLISDCKTIQNRFVITMKYHVSPVMAYAIFLYLGGMQNAALLELGFDIATKCLLPQNASALLANRPLVSEIRIHRRIKT